MWQLVETFEYLMPNEWITLKNTYRNVQQTLSFGTEKNERFLKRLIN